MILINKVVPRTYITPFHAISQVRFFMFNLIFTALDPRISRQGIADNSETESLSANALPGFDEIAQAGERCVEKVMMVEEITYDDQIVCHHSYTKKCHNTYITSFEAVQVCTKYWFYI